MTRQTTVDAPISPLANGNGPIDKATLELLASWRQEDAHASPEQIKAAAEYLLEFKRAMNENRTLAGEPLLYP